jgi:hypothetical protein
LKPIHRRLIALALLAAPFSVECGGKVSGSGNPAGSGGVGGVMVTGGVGGTGSGPVTGGVGGTGGMFPTGGTGGTFATGGTGGGFFTGGTGGTGVGPTSLGKACATNTDCDLGMTCLTPDSNINGGGPGGGYCTKSCTSNVDCQALDANASCVNLGTATAPAAYCLEGCTQGGSTGSADPNKCHARITDGEGPVACTQLGGFFDAGPFGVSACEPTCGDNADCGDKKCDLSTGFCDSSPKTGDPIGAPCDPQAIQGGAADLCAGICINDNPNDPTKGECSALCAVGSVGCGAEQGQVDAACLFVFDETAGVGDVGACGQLCDCDSDCHNPADVCNSLAGTNYDTVTGRAGYCAPAAGNPGIPNCP